jgi:hypothetical protein
MKDFFSHKTVAKVADMCCYKKTGNQEKNDVWTSTNY